MQSLVLFFRFRVKAAVFLRSLWETLPIIQRLRVGTSLTIVWENEIRSHAGVNLGNLE